jgi:hypothetical protein
MFPLFRKGKEEPPVMQEADLQDAQFTLGGVQVLLVERLKVAFLLVSGCATDPALYADLEKHLAGKGYFLQAFVIEEG